MQGGNTRSGPPRSSVRAGFSGLVEFHSHIAGRIAERQDKLGASASLPHRESGNMPQVRLAPLAAPRTAPQPAAGSALADWNGIRRQAPKFPHLRQWRDRSARKAATARDIRAQRIAETRRRGLPDSQFLMDAFRRLLDGPSTMQQRNADYDGSTAVRRAVDSHFKGGAIQDPQSLLYVTDADALLRDALHPLG